MGKEENDTQAERDRAAEEGEAVVIATSVATTRFTFWFWAFLLLGLFMILFAALDGSIGYIVSGAVFVVVAICFWFYRRHFRKLPDELIVLRGETLTVYVKFEHAFRDFKLSDLVDVIAYQSHGGINEYGSMQLIFEDESVGIDFVTDTDRAKSLLFRYKEKIRVERGDFGADYVCAEYPVCDGGGRDVTYGPDSEADWELVEDDEDSDR